MCRSDSRVDKLNVETYLKLPLVDGGRYPDIYVELKDGRKFVFEVQLSPPQHSLIAQRRNDYLSSGINLIWILDRGQFPDEELPFSAFRAIGAEHSGNIFMIDLSTCSAGERSGRIQFDFVHYKDEQLEDPETVGLDDLILSPIVLPFVEDLISHEGLSRANTDRWHLTKILATANASYSEVILSRRLEIFEEIQDQIGLGVDLDEEAAASHLCHFVLVFVSTLNQIIRPDSDFINFRDNHPNATSLLNSYFNRRDTLEAIPIFQELIEKSNALSSGVLKESTVRKISEKLEIYRSVGDRRMSELYRTMAEKVCPEIFDTGARKCYQARKSLPVWATNPVAQQEIIPRHDPEFADALGIAALRSVSHM